MKKMVKHSKKSSTLFFIIFSVFFLSFLNHNGVYVSVELFFSSDVSLGIQWTECIQYCSPCLNVVAFAFQIVTGHAWSATWTQSTRRSWRLRNWRLWRLTQLLPLLHYQWSLPSLGVFKQNSFTNPSLLLSWWYPLKRSTMVVWDWS